ncbi:hypothetical protein J4230_01175 [Candidatus Woesearchaeota archaeon]|nr:hypothetical protein [Candidatus Woesearchaeota archaeon]
MKDNCNYNKAKLLIHLCPLRHRLEKYYVPDAEKAGHPLCAAIYRELAGDLKKYEDKLNAAIEGLSKEGKFK